ncbi:hypothetical protein KBT16_17130, partial [Nostoc sp. CCCryo 231-06]|nr:hypothetical protein [Nostoc sp. CCCryo 231-06]
FISFHTERTTVFKVDAVYIPDFFKKSGIYLSQILTLLPRLSDSLTLNFPRHVEIQAIANAKNSPNQIPVFAKL